MRLKDHEIRLLDLLAAGHLVREIAAIEGLKESTITGRMHYLREKLNLVDGGRRKGTLLVWAAQNGWEVSAFKRW